MITENLTTLKINKLTQAQYDAALASGNINENELYMTPDEVQEEEITSISKGGTNANNVSDARLNLGFTYGANVPTEAPTTGEGSVYFKINEDEIDLSLTTAEYQELMDLINTI